MQDVDRRSRDLEKLDHVLELLGVGVLAGLLLGFVPLLPDGILDAGREAVFPVVAVAAGVMAVDIDLPSRPRRLFAIFIAVAAGHVAWAIQDMARATESTPPPVAHGLSAVVFTAFSIATLGLGFVAFCGAMIGAAKHLGAEPAEAAWKATLRFTGRAGLVLGGAGLLGWVGHLLDAGAVVTVSVITAVVAAVATFIKALSAGATTRRWIEQAVGASGAPDELDSSAPPPLRRRAFFDRPLWRDWLALVWLGLWLVGIIVAPFTARGLYLFDTLANLAFLYLIVGIGGGSIRMFVRGYREGRAADTSPGSAAM